MATVTVKIVYTPRPENNRVLVPICTGYAVVALDPDGFVAVSFSAADCDTSSPHPTEALDLARALALVAGCAGPHWRGWH